MRLAIGKRPEPSAENADPSYLFSICEMPQASPPFGRDDTGRMIGKARKNRNSMSCLRPVMGQFSGACSRRAHLRREILRNVKDFHRTVEGIAKWSNRGSDAIDIAFLDCAL